MADPAFTDGTIYICTDVIRAGDPSVFGAVTAKNPPRGTRTVYDRRDDAADTSCPQAGTGDGWIDINAYLFDATFSDTATPVEVAVNPEFTAAEAEAQATTYARVIGLLPKAARRDLTKVWIHKGDCAFGGADGHLVIHTGRSADYVARKNLAETIVHELTHVSLDGNATSAGWLAAQNADPAFISQYAKDNPTREDVAESFLAWLAVRYREDRLTSTTASKILGAMLHRIAYFDGLNLDMGPIPSPRRGPPGRR